MLQMLPLSGAILGAIIGAIGLVIGFSRRRPVPLEAAPTFTVDPRLELMLQELRGILEDGRTEISKLNEDSSGSAHDTVMVTVRLAGAALDAESRLAAAVTQAEEAMVQPASALARSAEAAQRVERILPELTDLITKALATRETEAEQMMSRLEACATRLSAAADGVAGMAQASLGEAAAALRQDAAALGRAGSQVANASTGAVANVSEAAALAVQSVSEAALRVDGAALEAAVAGLSGASAAASAAMRQECGALHEIVEQLSQTAAQADISLAALPEAAALVGAASDALREGRGLFEASVGAVVQRADTAAMQIAAVVTNAESTLTALAALPGVTAGLTDAAAHLRRDADTLGGAGREIVAAGEGAVARLDQALQALPEVAALVGAASDALREGRALFEDSVGAVVQRADTAATQIAAAVTNAESTLTALAGLPVVTAGLTDAAAHLLRDADTLGGAGREIVAAGEGAAARLDQVLQALPDTAALVGAASDVLREGRALLEGSAGTVSQMADAVTTQIATAVASAESRFATLPAVTAGLTDAAAHLLRDADTLGGAGREIVAASEGAATRLDRALQALPETVALMGAASDALREGRALLEGSAGTVSQMADTVTTQIATAVASAESSFVTLPAVTAGLTDAAAHLLREVDTLGGAGRDIVAAGEGAVARLDAMLQALPDTAALVGTASEALRQGTVLLETSVSTVAHMADTVTAAVTSAESTLKSFATLPVVTAELADAAAHLQRDAERLGATGREIAVAGESTVARLDAMLQTLPDTADMMGAASDRLHEGRSLLETSVGTVSQLADTATAQIAMAVRNAETAFDAFATLPATTTELVDAAARLLRDADTLDTSGRSIAAAGEGAVARLDVVLQRLPEAAALVDRASDTLRHGTALLEASTDTMARAVDTVTTAVASTEAPLNSLATLPAVTAGLADAAAYLLRDAGTLAASGREIVAAGEGAAARLDLVLQGLPAAAAAVDTATEALRDGRTLLETSAGTISQMADTAATQIAGAVTTAESTLHSFATLPAVTTGLVDAAAHLVRDADTLAASGREIVAAEESAATRLGLVLQELPRAAALVDTATEALRDERTLLETSASTVSQMADTAATQIAGAVTTAESTLSAFAALPAVTAGLTDAATHLLRDADTLGAAGREIVAAGEGAAARLDLVLQGLPGAAALVDTATEALRDGRALLETSAGTVSQMADTAATQIAGAVTTAESTLSAFATLPAVTRGLVDAAAHLLRDADTLAASGREIVAAEESAAVRLGLVLQELPRAAALVDTATGALREGTALLENSSGVVSQMADTMMERIATVVTNAESTFTTLPAITTGLVDAAAHLVRDADTLGVAGREIVAAGDGAAARLGLVLQELPQAAALVDTATEALREGRALLGTSAGAVSQMADTMMTQIATVVTNAESTFAPLPAVTAGLTDAAVHLARSTDTLGSTGREIVVAGEGAATRLGLVLQELPQAAALVDTATMALREGTALLETSAGAVSQMADTMVGRITTVVTDADSAFATLPMVTAGLTDAAAHLVRDADALGAAGREIVAVGEGAAARLGLVLQELPQTAALVDTATETLREGRVLLETSAGTVSQMADTMTAQVAAAVTTAETTLNSFAVLPAVTAALTDAAGHLLRGADALGATGREVVAAGEGAVTRLGLVLQELPQAAALVDTATETLREGTAVLEASAGVVSQMTDMAAAQIATAVTNAESTFDSFAAVPAVTAGLVDAAAHLRRDADTLGATGQKIALAGAGTMARLDLMVQALPETAALMDTASGALRESTALLEASVGVVSQMADTVTTQVAAAVATAESTLGVFTALPAVTTGLVDAAAHLLRDADALNATGQKIAAAGDGTVARLDLALQALPEATEEMAVVAGELQQQSSRLAATGQEMSARSASAIAGVIDAASRVEASAASLGAAGDGVAVQTERLAAVTAQAEAQAVYLPGFAAQIAGTAQRLQATTDALPLEAALAALPVAVGRLNEATAIACGQAAADEARFARLEAFSAQMTAEIGEAARQFDAAAARQNNADGRMAQAGNAARGEAWMRPPVDDDAAWSISKPGSEPAALDVTLLHLGSVEREASVLLHQAEALAEAVLAGKAPALPPLLAGRTPALLSGIDTTIQRLHSVATSLALASDGLPMREVA